MGTTSAGTGRYGQVTNIGGVVDTDNAFLSVGFSLDVERLLHRCRDGAYNNDGHNGMRKAPDKKALTMAARLLYPLSLGGMLPSKVLCN